MSRTSAAQLGSARLGRTAQFRVNRSHMSHYHQPTQPVSKDKSSIAVEVLSAVSRRTTTQPITQRQAHASPAVTRCAHARTEPQTRNFPSTLSHLCLRRGQTYPHPAAAPDIAVLRLVSAVKAPHLRKRRLGRGAAVVSSRGGG